MKESPQAKVVLRLFEETRMLLRRLRSELMKEFPSKEMCLLDRLPKLAYENRRLSVLLRTSPSVGLLKMRQFRTQQLK